MSGTVWPGVPTGSLIMVPVASLFGMRHPLAPPHGVEDALFAIVPTDDAGHEAVGDLEDCFEGGAMLHGPEMRQISGRTVNVYWLSD